MTAKRTPGRFTIQFNMNDPMHLMASEILEKQGRHKAQYITNAISFYQFHFDSSAENVVIPVTNQTISDHHSPHRQFESPPPSEKENVPQEHSFNKADYANEADDLDAYFAETEIPAIADTLAAFGKI